MFIYEIILVYELDVPIFLQFLFHFTDPIDQLAMDNTRGVLYCRTMKGNIKVIFLL